MDMKISIGRREKLARVCTPEVTTQRVVKCAGYCFHHAYLSTVTSTLSAVFAEPVRASWMSEPIQLT